MHCNAKKYIPNLCNIIKVLYYFRFYFPKCLVFYNYSDCFFIDRFYFWNLFIFSNWNRWLSIVYLSYGPVSLSWPPSLFLCRPWCTRIHSAGLSLCRPMFSSPCWTDTCQPLWVQLIWEDTLTWGLTPLQEVWWFSLVSGCSCHDDGEVHLQRQAHLCGQSLSEVLLFLSEPKIWNWPQMTINTQLVVTWVCISVGKCRRWTMLFWASGLIGSPLTFPSQLTWSVRASSLKTKTLLVVIGRNQASVC